MARGVGAMRAKAKDLFGDFSGGANRGQQTKTPARQL
jgi:hypothetical protein